MQQHVSHDMRVALTSGNAWMITNRDSSTRQAAFGATGKSFPWNPAGAGLPQEAWIRLGSHSRDDLLELADESGLR